MRVVLRCGSQARHILGEGRSARSIHAPYIFGIADGPHGILVLSPHMCNYDFTRYPVRADYQPVIFWAPDAKNLEFMIAYLHENAFDGPNSRLKFISATLTPATRQEYEDWRRATWPKNIVPLADDELSLTVNSNYFSGASSPIRLQKRTPTSTWFPANDLRNRATNHACYSMVRLRAGPELRDFLRRNRPSDNPRFWPLSIEMEKQFSKEIGKGFAFVSGAVPDESVPPDRATEPPASGAGVARGSERRLAFPQTSENKNLQATFGQVHRVPIYSSAAYPAMVAGGKMPPSTRDLMMGPLSDAGTAYCYRDLGYVFAQWRQYGDPIPIPHKVRAFVDGNLIGELDRRNHWGPIKMWIAESDEFIWTTNEMSLQNEWARNQ